MLARERGVPYLTLAAKVAMALGKQQEGQRLLEEALEAGKNLAILDDWELGWFLAAARLAKASDLIAAAEQEKKNRERDEAAPTHGDGYLPALKDDWLC